jgi:hypothetical protein
MNTSATRPNSRQPKHAFSLARHCEARFMLISMLLVSNGSDARTCLLFLHTTSLFPTVTTNNCADDLITVLTAASRGLPGTANRASVQQLLTELRSSSTAATDTDTAAAASIITAEGWEQRIQSWRLGVHTIQQV